MRIGKVTNLTAELQKRNRKLTCISFQLFFKALAKDVLKVDMSKSQCILKYILLCYSIL